MIRKILHNQSGVAILMVLTTVTVLTLLMFTFRYETSVNKIKAYNITGKSQARMNAESGLHLALIRLEIYQKAINFLGENKNLSQFAASEMLNQVWSFPLKFPFEITGDMGLADKDAVNKFEENLILEGEIMTTVNSFANKLNLNALRASEMLKFLIEFDKKQNSNSTIGSLNGGQTGSTTAGSNNNQTNPQDDKLLNIEERFKELIKTALDRKIETDEYFANRYSGIDINELIAAVKFYISDRNTDIGPLQTQVQADFEKLGITPKHAPMTSVSELNLLPYWNDDLIGLIKNEITVHGDMIIDINKLTANLIRLIVPEITDEQIAEFYKYQQNNGNPITFESGNDLTNYFADEARIVSKSEMSDRFALLKKAGITFGSKPSLFKVISTGISSNAKYTINAIVVLPQVAKKTNIQSGTGSTTSNFNTSGTTSNGSTTSGNQNGQNDTSKFEFAKPKVIEIFVN